MISRPPEYFLRIQKEAQRRWDQLEADPDLAGPWWQLFRQVQSPRHVLSELLQNADDAGATWVRAKLEDGCFKFAHNGEDFNDETFHSLCQFGRSNKRHLHTIGFRGIGFKSVFSLGPRVEVTTQTLSFSFEKERFTEPVWVQNHKTNEMTAIRVPLDKDFKSNILLKEFQRWSKSPYPLLFFNHIQQIAIQNKVIEKEIVGSGPVSGSKIVCFTKPEKREVLFAKSKPEGFPEEAMEEIREERGDPKFVLPPCTVQIAFDTSSGHRLYTVLPTEVQPMVPFSANGPFIQDPDRKEIKSPANSATNTWLLRRTGWLAANVMIEWLRNTSLDLAERARAYKLLPRPTEPGGTLNQECKQLILDGFQDCIKKQGNILLCHDGSLEHKDNSVALPRRILQTWDAGAALNIFAPEKQKVLSSEVEHESRQNLKKWGLVKILDREGVFFKLKRAANPGPPRPNPIQRLIHLWSYLSPLKRDWNFKEALPTLPIVPVSRRDELLSAEEVLVVGGREKRITENDWAFLMDHTELVEPKWLNFMTKGIADLTKGGGEGSRNENRLLIKNLPDALDLYNALSLRQRVGLEQVIEAAAKRIFEEKNPGEKGIELARIAARGNATVPFAFKYLLRDEVWRPTEDSKLELLAEGAGDLGILFPKDWLRSHVISSRYEKNLTAEECAEWRKWTSEMPKCKLTHFPLPKKQIKYVWSEYEISKFCRERGGEAPSNYPIKRSDFQVTDYDWDESLWAYWNEMAQRNPAIWLEIGKSISGIWSELWFLRLVSEAKQAGNKYLYDIDHGTLKAAWVSKLSSLPCLLDSFGKPGLPAELYRRTPETEPLLNVERFLHPDLDRSHCSAFLDWLGVRSKPSGVVSLLDRLRALSRAENPPISHLVDIYRLIDRALLSMAREEAGELQEVFLKEHLIYTSDGYWENLTSAFLDNPDGIPGVSVIHPETRDLAIWTRFGGAKHPTFEMTLAWLNSLQCGTLLSATDRLRTIQIIRSAPERVWQKCDAWIDASGRWTEIGDLNWGAAGGPLIAGLFNSIKKRTADFSMLDGFAPRFCSSVGLTQLESSLEQRLVNYVPKGPRKMRLWMKTLGEVLCRLLPNDKQSKDLVDSDRNTAKRLSESTLQPVHDLKTAPYVDGQPAGPEQQFKVVWHANTIYAVGKAPRHHRDFVREISRHFQSPQAKRAIVDCIDRDSEWITAYAKEHLDLEDELEAVKTVGETAKKTDEHIMGGAKVGLNGIDENGAGKETADEGTYDETDEQEDTTRIEEDETQFTQDGQKRRKQRQDKLTEGFIDFALKRGFQWVKEQEYFVNKQGHLIIKASNPFNWVEYNGSKQLQSYFWVGRGSIQKGVEISSEVWNLKDSLPYEIYLVLVDEREKVNAFTLYHLKEQVRNENIELYSATIRLRAKV